MRGKVLGYSEKDGTGVILSDVGDKRYDFAADDFQSEYHPAVGSKVDFEVNEDKAVKIYEIQEAGNGLGGSGDKNKVVAGILALFLGAFGIHKFYLGCNTAGIVTILTFFLGFILLGIPTIIISIIVFIEAIKYLIASDADFNATYVQNKKCWF